MFTATLLGTQTPSGKAVYCMGMRVRYLFSSMLIVLGRLNTDKIREILTIYTFQASYFHAVMENTICSFTYVEFDANTIM